MPCRLMTQLAPAADPPADDLMEPQEQGPVSVAPRSPTRPSFTKTAIDKLEDHFRFAPPPHRWVYVGRA